MSSIAIGRPAGAFLLATGVVLAWIGDHYPTGGPGAIVAVWLIAVGTMMVVVARRKHGWWWATLLAFVLTGAFVLVALGGAVAEPAQGHAGNCTVLMKTVASAGVVPVSIVEPPLPAIACSAAQHGVFLRQFNDIEVWGVVSQQQHQAVLD